MEAVLPSELTPFLDYFRAFKKVRDGSFNSHTYDVNTPVYIEEVVKTAKALKPFGLNFIPKLHMMLHVPAFCERVGAPLGKFGDQGIEQVLYVCLSVWFKVLFLHLSSLFKAQSKPRCIQIIRLEEPTILCLVYRSTSCTRDTGNAGRQRAPTTPTLPTAS